MKSVLRSVPLLYLVFLLSLLHMGYFLLHHQKENITFFVLIATFVYLNFPNMIVVLASAMVSVDLISLARKGFNAKEGFDTMDGSMNPMDLSANVLDPSMDPSVKPSVEPSEKPLGPFADLSGVFQDMPFTGIPEGMPFTKGLPPGVSSTGISSEPFANDKEPTRYLESMVRDMFKKEPMVGNDMGEVQGAAEELDKKIKHTQANHPELDTKINVAEFNTLMSRLNQMIGSFTDE